MDKRTSDIATQTSDVKEEMGLKWIKQPATLPRKHPSLVSALLFVMCNKASVDTALLQDINTYIVLSMLMFVMCVQSKEQAYRTSSHTKWWASLRL